MSSNSNELREELGKYIYCTSSCGVNALDALGYDVACTCGAEKDLDQLEKLLADREIRSRIKGFKMAEQIEKEWKEYGGGLSYKEFYTERLEPVKESGNEQR